MSEFVQEHEFEVDPEPTIDSEQSVIINNPTVEQTYDDGPLSSLNHEQRTRVGALNMAKPLLVSRGTLGGTTPPDIGDLLRLATWILDGNDEPLYPYVSGQIVILGPDISVDIDGDTVHWKGTRYLKDDE